ncbi:MAG TPA: hypothetical protein VFU22_23115 [Roseiflexaceae bacterium]|nr:hypothetical protein [Roseiflexaceae bacterium]
MRPVIHLIAMPEDTNFAPLGVLGYCLTRTDFLQPVLANVQLPLKAVQHTVADKLLDVLVSILAGCRAITQVNTRLRPDLALARAWGRTRFADQSTLARTLDHFTDAQLTQLRQGSEALFRRESRTFRHSFADDWLWLDIDLTPLPSSKHAEGSTKGKISAKKTATAARWRGCMPHSITKRSSHGYTPVSKRVARPISPSWRRSTPFWPSVQRRKRARSCARTRALGVIAT